MQIVQPHDIILHWHEGGIQHINNLHASYAPLHYVLLFPYGTSGWTQTLEQRPTAQRNNASHNQRLKCLSQLQFYAYCIHTHLNEFPIIHHGGCLFQQYLCDIWVSTDQNRLCWVENSQSTLRATLYSGLEDVIACNDDNLNLNNISRWVILPSSYVSSPRYMNLRFQDAMALARYYHGFDLFITFTTNPNWPEITHELFPRQSPSNQPDLITRVFNLYKTSLIHDLTILNIFSDVQAHVHTIKFQKWGLPHMHLLLSLTAEFHPTTAHNIDTIIRATWPDPVHKPRLFQIVLRSMVHGPCSQRNPNAPCMKDGQCTKGFPKPFQPETVMTDSGYPIYTRPNDAHAYIVQGVLLDNRWIVLYNPYLLYKYVF
jgi:Helitron helicase-like domain at N-terminus